MVGLAYASVPLYRIFCQVTGYGGTTMAADAGSDVVLDRTVTIRFDANTARDMPWQFQAQQRRMTLKIGETGLAFYRASNPTAKAVTGTATFNVTPPQAGAYFNKIECFCFTEQTLEPGASADMPVSFFVDPAIVDDPELAGIGTITLSYTFFPATRKQVGVAGVAGAGAKAN
jgi:cytochrome c oxidase assembly protein subunit 11